MEIANVEAALERTRWFIALLGQNQSGSFAFSKNKAVTP
jgi:hypothetical protein